MASGRLGDRRGWGDYYIDWGGDGATVTLTCGRGMDRHIAKEDAYTLSVISESWKTQLRSLGSYLFSSTLTQANVNKHGGGTEEKTPHPGSSGIIDVTFKLILTFKCLIA